MKLVSFTTNHPLTARHAPLFLLIKKFLPYLDSLNKGNFIYRSLILFSNDIYDFGNQLNS